MTISRQYDDDMMIRSERARMGGDWAVCSILLTRKIRDIVRWNFLSSCNKMPLLYHREELGEELHVICLDMQPEDQIARWSMLFLISLVTNVWICSELLTCNAGRQDNRNELKVPLKQGPIKTRRGSRCCRNDEGEKV